MSVLSVLNTDFFDEKKDWNPSIYGGKNVYYSEKRDPRWKTVFAKVFKAIEANKDQSVKVGGHIYRAAVSKNGLAYINRIPADAQVEADDDIKSLIEDLDQGAVSAKEAADMYRANSTDEEDSEDEESHF